MRKRFLSENFLLQNEVGKELYFEFAKDMPIFDYHCHLQVQQIAENSTFSNISEIWLAHDHYKWRAMRTNGIEERYITGDASDYEKFLAWSKTVPYTIRNPLFHWTHMELKTYFHIEDILLNQETAGEIYKVCNRMLGSDEFGVRALLKKMNVRVLCTTDDPCDSLEYHRQIAEDNSFDITVVPAFRPDRAFQVENPAGFNEWVSMLEESSKTSIHSLSSFIGALRERHRFFHEMGCRISDHGIEYPYSEDFTEREARNIFDAVRAGNTILPELIRKFKSFMLKVCAQMDADRNWVQQFHFGVLRNNNSRYMELLGPNSGFDSIGDYDIGAPLVNFLNNLDTRKALAKTVLYNINPRDNELVVSIAGSFQDGSVPAKIQVGPGWWFNDTKEGMIRQMNALSNLGLLSRFIGITTDSRSFLSFPRHDYFRRILCNILGDEVESGELPEDLDFLGGIVQDICYNNASSYFGIV